MLRHGGNGFDNGGSTTRSGPPVTAARRPVGEIVADAIYVDRCAREGGFPRNYPSAAVARLFVAIDAVRDELGFMGLRRLLLQAILGARAAERAR